ncbi:MAG: lysophospholipid acyltransferase family protein [Candidatus Omnitrophota bacterium]
MAKKKPYRFAVYLLARAAAAPVFWLPRRWALAFARLAGLAAYAFVWRQKRKVLAHLNLAYGASKSGAEIRAIGRQVFSHAAQTAVEILQFPKLDERKIDAFVDFASARSYLDAVLSEGKGVICLTAHLGNWELLAGALCTKGIPMTVVGRRIYYEPYQRWIVRIRESVKMRLVDRSEGAREILSCLKRGEVVGLLPDQDVDSLPGIWVDFFGRPAYTMTAPVKLSLKTGAPMVAGFLVREPGDRYRLVFSEAIRPVVETTFEEAVKKYTIRWMRDFEAVIRQYPGQWMWMHDRWKTRPPADVS